MNELNSVKSEQSVSLDSELDLRIEDFDDRIIYQIPEEFALNPDFCQGDSQNLSGFTFSIGDDGDRG